MRAGTDDKVGLNRHNIILQHEKAHGEYLSQQSEAVIVTDIKQNLYVV